MKPSPLTFIIVILLVMFPVLTCVSQSWQFVKEKNGIRLYLRQENNSSFKAFQGVTEFRGDFDKVCSLIGDPRNLDWWGDDVKNIKVLSYEKDRQIRYYFVYDTPWPFSDRDLVAEVLLSKDPITGTKTVSSKQLLNVVPQHEGLVRVTHFWQKWTIQPMKSGMIHVTLEGFIDPAGDIPAWLYNMIIIDIPMRLLRDIRQRAGVSG
ncbi:MAG TPA: hypothetical protein PK796_02875 [Bacteroidales bacterium]|jgi:hypothetical protein|nr:hypothetical protein [Bacteroidales bacterium]